MHKLDFNILRTSYYLLLNLILCDAFSYNLSTGILDCFQMMCIRAIVFRAIIFRANIFGAIVFRAITIIKL